MGILQYVVSKKNQNTLSIVSTNFYFKQKFLSEIGYLSWTGEWFMIKSDTFLLLFYLTG